MKIGKPAEKLRTSTSLTFQNTRSNAHGSVHLPFAFRLLRRAGSTACATTVSVGGKLIAGKNTRSKPANC